MTEHQKNKYDSIFKQDKFPTEKERQREHRYDRYAQQQRTGTNSICEDIPDHYENQTVLRQKLKHS